MVHIQVDGKQIAAEEGISLLKACLANEVFIPNLCYMEGFDPAPASCRLCFVEIQGVANPVTACTVPVKAGLVVQTDTPAVRRLQRTALRLLLSVHDVDCKNCHANKRCALQDLAKFLNVRLKPRRYGLHLKETHIDTRHPCLDYYPNRCVLCGRCVAVCRAAHDHAALTFAKRGFATTVSFFGHAESFGFTSRPCRACVAVCPVGAMALKNDCQPD
jgi:bidirectional [NiFe] hydrogenase diaphorase subunit